MRNLALFSLLLCVALAISLVGSPTQRVLAQEEQTMGDTVNFDVGGPDFDPNVQRVAPPEAVSGVFVVLVLLIAFVGFALSIVAMLGAWKVFAKAGQPGWAVIIPIYNAIVLLNICGRPVWWIILLLIPCVNIVFSLIVMIDLAKSFGKDALFGIGLVLFGFIFFPILGFSDAQYQGPAAAQ